jgi:DNA-binding Lrp family transcriptional regulator
MQRDPQLRLVDPTGAPDLIARHQPVLERAWSMLCMSGVLANRGLGLDEKVLWAFIRVADYDATQNELCELFGLARSTLNRMLRRLENLGLITQRQVGLNRPNRRRARQPEKVAVDATERHAKAAQALALAREQRAQRRAQSALAVQAQQSSLLPGVEPTAVIGTAEALAGLARDVGVNFTRAQVRRLESTHGKDLLLKLARDWYEHRLVAKARFGELAPRTIARFIIDGAGVPDNLRAKITIDTAVTFDALPRDLQGALLQAVTDGEASHAWCTERGIPTAALVTARERYHRNPHIASEWSTS